MLVGKNYVLEAPCTLSVDIALFTSGVDRPDTGPGVYRENLARAMLKVKRPDDTITFVHFKNHDNEIYEEGNEIVIQPNRWLVKGIENAGAALGHPIANPSEVNISDYHLTNSHDFDVFHHQAYPYYRPSWYLLSEPKLVTTIHFFVRPELHPQQYSRWARIKNRYLNKWFSRKYDALITISQESKQLHAELLGIEDEKIYVTPNAVPSEMSPTKRRDVLDEYGIDEPYVFHLSNQAFYKNPKGIVQGYEKAIKRYDTPHNLVIGGGGWTKQDLLSYATTSSLTERITCTGYIDRETLNQFYSHADFFYLPSHSEGLPFVVLEALSCNTPVLTTANFGMPEVVGSAGVFVDDTTDSAEIARKIEEIRHRDFQQIPLKKSKEYTWERTARQTLEIYRDVMGKD